MVSLTNSDILNLPKIRFEPDEYVIGTLFIKNYNDEKMFELYELNIPYNAESIDIECISETAKLLIYIGNELKDNNDFEVNPGKTINLLRQDIINKYTKSNINSIENINIIICVYAEKIDLIDISYSFKVHLNQKDNQLKIYKINTSQKTLCQPIEIIENQKYRCLFMITPSKLSSIKYLILYSKSPKNIKTSIYGNYLPNNYIYDLYYENLTHLIPDENAQYNSEINNKDYILLPPDENQKYLYVSVISNSSRTIEFISNFYKYNEVFIPDSNLMQIFVLNKDLKNEIKLNFISENPIMVKIESIYGKGEIIFNEKIYNLKDENDKIIFALSSNIDDYLIIKNEGNTDNILSEEEDFLFYVEYYFRYSTNNFDKIDGENSKIVYKDTNYPLFLYSNIDNNGDYNIFFYFYDLTLNKASSLTKIIKNKELNILITLSEEKNKYQIINDFENEEFKIKGIYDPAINIGLIYIPKENISEYNDLQYYLKFSKNGENANIIYNEISMESTYIKENSGTLIKENKYYFGKIYNNNTINSYKLQIDKFNQTNYFIIQFSANSEIINFTINIEENNQETNYTFDEYERKEENGKIITIFKKPNDINYIYLNVFIINNNI